MIKTSELLKLEQDILSIYKDGHPYHNHQNYMLAGLKSLLVARKTMINLDLRDCFASPILGDCGLIDEIVEFNNTLEQYLKRSYDTFKHIVDIIVNQDDINVNSYFQLSVYMAECPDSMNNQNEYGNSLWDIFNDKAFNDDVSYDKYSPPIQNKLFEMTSIGYEEVDDKELQWAMELTHPLAGWGTGELASELEKLELIRPVETLIKRSCFAITDFAYCRDFRAEINLNLGY